MLLIGRASVFQTDDTSSILVIRSKWKGSRLVNRASLVAAASAVALWSSTPFLLRLVSSQESVVTYAASAAIAMIVTVLIAAVRYRSVASRLVQDKAFVLSSFASGALLAVWYCCFYESLQGPSVALASGVAFTWPVISLLSMRFYRTGRISATVKETGLLSLSLIGVILVTSGSHENSSSSIGIVGSLVFAALASLGSGLYLPFGVKALERCREIAQTNSVESTFFAVGFSNVFSLGCVAVFLLATHVPRGVSVHVDPLSSLGYVLIGVGVYLVAEIAWTFCNSQRVSAIVSMRRSSCQRSLLSGQSCS